MKQAYDLIVPLGYACSCSQSMRRAGLQLASFPWDWVGVPPPPERCRIICEGFKDFINLEDLYWAGMSDTYGHEEVLNRRNGLIILHDFVQGIPLEDQYPVIAAKYARRKERLEKCLRAARRVLLVTIDAPVTPTPTTPKECREAIDVMSSAYPNASFDYLLINLEMGRDKESRIDETPLPGVRRIAFDYKSHAPDSPAYGVEIDMLADLLRSEYSVHDYRTKEEIDAYKAKRGGKRKRKLQRKMEALGAKTKMQYHLYRIRSAWRRVLSAIGPKSLAARIRRRRYWHIIPFGANEEVAFRLKSRWNIGGDSPFAAAAARNLATLISVLARCETLHSEPFEFNQRTQMWRNANDEIEFHGRRVQKEGAPPPLKADLDKDLAELRVDLRKRFEKFMQSVADDRETLLVHRLSDEDASAPDLAKRLADLEEAMEKVGARKCIVLIVCRTADLVKMPTSTCCVFRGVKTFNPSEHVAWGELGDPVGWNAIFTEFAPTAAL